MTYIIIGRSATSGKLSLAADGSVVECGITDSVPVSVAGSHCRISADGDMMRIENLNIDNYLFVNGQAVEAKRITPNDVIELGMDHFRLDWNVVLPLLPADIRPLERVWTDFDRHRIDQQIADRRFSSLRSATGLITMAAIALSITTGRQSPWFVVLYAMAIVISLIFTIKAWHDASAVPKKAQQLSRQFQHDYACPRCGHFLGNQPYELLVQNTNCPYCKAKFIH